MKYFLWAALLSLGLAACQSNSNDSGKGSAGQPNAGQAKTAAPVKKTIVFFGNSLTAAYQLSIEQGFVAIIQRKIDTLGLPFRCVNAGLSGETTADGKNRVDWVLQQPVDIFVLELGGNDALRGLPVAESKQNLQHIIDQVKAKYPAAKIILAGMLAPPNLGAAYTNAFHDMYPALAKANHTGLIPFLLEGVGGNPALNLQDGIHPNPDGQKIVAETVWKEVKGVISEK